MFDVKFSLVYTNIYLPFGYDFISYIVWGLYRNIYTLPAVVYTMLLPHIYIFSSIIHDVIIAL